MTRAHPWHRPGLILIASCLILLVGLCVWCDESPRAQDGQPPLTRPEQLSRPGPRDNDARGGKMYCNPLEVKPAFLLAHDLSFPVVLAPLPALSPRRCKQGWYNARERD